ncbi:MAG: hypothetical protein V7646_8109, partial [Pseudonocardia sp.]
MQTIHTHKLPSRACCVKGLLGCENARATPGGNPSQTLPGPHGGVMVDLRGNRARRARTALCLSRVTGGGARRIRTVTRSRSGQQSLPVHLCGTSCRGAYSGGEARRVQRQQIDPPPREPVDSDVDLQVGRRARHRASEAILLAVIAVGCAIGAAARYLIGEAWLTPRGRFLSATRILHFLHLHRRHPAPDRRPAL